MGGIKVSRSQAESVERIAGPEAKAETTTRGLTDAIPRTISAGEELPPTLRDLEAHQRRFLEVTDSPDRSNKGFALFETFGGAGLPLMGFSRFFRRKAPPKALPAPKSRDEAYALARLQGFQAERLPWYIRLVEADFIAGFAMVKLDRGRKELGIYQTVLGAAGIAIAAFLQNPWFLSSILLLKNGMQWMGYFKTKGAEFFARSQNPGIQFDLKVELNALPLSHSQQAFDLQAYTAGQIAADKLGLSLELLLALNLREADTGRVEKVLDEVYGDHLGPKLFLIREGKLRGGLNLLLSALRAPKLSQEAQTWLLEAVGELGDPRALPTLRAWVGGQVFEVSMESRMAAAVAMEKIGAEKDDAAVIRRLFENSTIRVPPTKEENFIDELLSLHGLMTRFSLLPPQHYSMEALNLHGLRRYARIKQWEPLEKLLSGDVELPIGMGAELCELLFQGGRIGPVKTYLEKRRDEFSRGAWGGLRDLGPETLQIERIKLMMLEVLLDRWQDPQGSDLTVAEFHLVSAGDFMLSPIVQLELAKALLRIGQVEKTAELAKLLLKDPNLSIQAAELLDRAEPGWINRHIMGLHDARP